MTWLVLKVQTMKNLKGNNLKFVLFIYLIDTFFIRRRRTLTVYKMVFNEEPNALIWEENVLQGWRKIDKSGGASINVSQPSSRVILKPNLIGKGLKSIRFEHNEKSFNLALKVS